MHKVVSPKSSVILSVLAFLLLSISACHKEDYNSPKLRLVDAGIPTDSIATGDSVTIRPFVNNYASTVYEWRVGDSLVSVDSSYTFKSDEPGDYVVDFRAFNTETDVVTQQYTIHVFGKYEHGIFIINEGQFGVSNGSVNFVKYGTDSIQLDVFARENAASQLGISTDFGAIADNRLYIVSKQGALVVADSRTLKEKGRISSLPAEGHAFLPVNASTALLSTADGIYPVDLTALTVGSKIAGVDGETGSLIAGGDHVFALNDSLGLVVLNTSDWSVDTVYAGLTEGLTKTNDGMVWAAGDSLLVSLDPSSLDTVQTHLPFAAANMFGAWNAGSLTASTTEDAVFISEPQPLFVGGTSITKYLVGDTASLATPFITLPAGKELYGGSPRYDASTNWLVATAMQSGFGSNSSMNSLYFYNATSGALEQTIDYTGYYFPSLVVFNP